MIARKVVGTLLLSISALVFGQEETLFKEGNIRSGGFGGPVMRFSPVNGEFGVFVGGRGGWLLNSVFSIGAGGWGLANKVDSDHPDTARLSIGVGGLILEGIFRPHRLVHGSAAVLIGGGGVSATDQEFRQMEHRNMREGFFVLEPEINLEVNIVKFFRICPGISYRFIAGESEAVESTWDISGPSANLMLKFGKF